MSKHLSYNESYPPLRIVSLGQTTSLKTRFTCKSPAPARDTVLGWFILATSVFKGQTHPSIEGAKTSLLSFFGLNQANHCNFQQQEGELVWTMRTTLQKRRKAMSCQFSREPYTILALCCVALRCVALCCRLFCSISSCCIRLSPSLYHWCIRTPYSAMQKKRTDV